MKDCVDLYKKVFDLVPLVKGAINESKTREAGRSNLEEVKAMLQGYVEQIERLLATPVPSNEPPRMTFEEWRKTYREPRGSRSGWVLGMLDGLYSLRAEIARVQRGYRP